MPLPVAHAALLREAVAPPGRDPDTRTDAEALRAVRHGVKAPGEPLGVELPEGLCVVPAVVPEERIYGRPPLHHELLAKGLHTLQARGLVHAVGPQPGDQLGILGGVLEAAIEALVLVAVKVVPRVVVDHRLAPAGALRVEVLHEGPARLGGVREGAEDGAVAPGLGLRGLLQPREVADLPDVAFNVGMVQCPGRIHRGHGVLGAYEEPVVHHDRKPIDRVQVEGLPLLCTRHGLADGGRPDAEEPQGGEGAGQRDRGGFRPHADARAQVVRGLARDEGRELRLHTACTAQQHAQLPFTQLIRANDSACGCCRRHSGRRRHCSTLQARPPSRSPFLTPPHDARLPGLHGGGRQQPEQGGAIDGQPRHSRSVLYLQQLPVRRGVAGKRSSEPRASHLPTAAC
mmetsp:Transcript_30472/g.101307  ORF Transcript_30472/g.101307 Transcript_30472/m.101307 type:complete len:401 (+) Transcript_30472:1364-2566(+)